MPSDSINLSKAIRPGASPPKPFGSEFTENIFIARYTEGVGWDDGVIIPRSTLSIDPAATVLHYGQAVFDGLKAYLGHDGILRMFRPGAHVERLRNSAARLCIPDIDPQLVMRSFHRLLEVDGHCVPRAPGSLYLRPMIIGVEAFLGVRSARQFLYVLLISPVGDYYADGFAPLKLIAADTYSRAAPGGLGGAKTPANYAASLLAGEEARSQGYDQVLWLDACRHQYLEEVGMMNIMLRVGDEVVTPPLTGTILPGVTRDSCLHIMRDWGLWVVERPISIGEVIEAARDGRLKEVWGTGTAAVIAPIGEITFRGEKFVIGGNQIGPLTQRLYAHLRNIQLGETEDRKHWLSDVAHSYVAR